MSPNKYIYTFSSYETLQVHFSKIWDAKKEAMKIIKHLRKSPHLKRNEFVFSDATNNPRSKKRSLMLKVFSTRPYKKEGRPDSSPKRKDWAALTRYKLLHK